MTHRVVAQLSRTTGRVQCSRCLDVIDVTSGHWRAAEADHHHVVVCDRCSQRDDPDGWQTVEAWRKAARATRGGTRR
jgi:Fe2+ or Zn2+ uptake regulation protein